MRRWALLLIASLLCGAASRGGQPPASGHYGVTPGLVAMGNLFFAKNSGCGAEDNTLEEPNLHPNLYVGTALNFCWGTLEPSQGTFDFSALNTALAAVATYNAAHPSFPMFAKIMVWVGEDAPTWAKNLDGGPISLPGDSGTIGLWWMADYRAAWKTLQDTLAASYNNNALVKEVGVTSCAQFSEPFSQPLNNGSAGLANVLAAGYTDQAGFACLRGALADYSSWTKPALIFPFNPMKITNGSGTATQTTSPNVITVMEMTRAGFGQGATVGNQALSSPLDSTFTAWFAYMCPLNGPVEFQIQASEFKTDPPNQDAAFAVGQSYCMTQFEMWNTSGQGSVPNTTLPELQGWSVALGGYPG